MLYFNARSIRNKLTDLEVILKTDKYDLLFITETWLDNNDLSSFVIDTTNYGIIRCDRATHGGGVAVVYNLNLSGKIVPRSIDLSELVGFEITVFDFYTSPQLSICFICLYLPPQSSSDITTVRNLLKILKRFIKEKEVYIIGDFNFSKFSNNMNANLCKEPLKEFISFLEEYNLHQLITTPTHLHGNILDLVITSHPHKVTNLEVLDPFTATCDHNMLEIKTCIKNTTRPKSIRKFNFYKANYDYINSYLSTINWETILSTSNNINEMYSKFLYILHNTINKFVPLSKTNRRPFLPKEIKKILKEKKALHHKLKTDKSLKDLYNIKCKQYKIALRKYKRDCETKVLKSKNKKTLYNHIKNKTHSRHNIPPLTDPDGQICLDPQLKANLLNNTFGKVFLKNTSSTCPSLNNNSQISLQLLNSVSRQDILESISNLKTSVSRTPDEIPALFIKNTAFNLLTPLFILFNYSLSTNQIPEIWKRAIVIPIYKKGKLNIASNYRPISLTSVVCRLLERIIHKQLNSHILHNNIISYAQHGFMHKRSTQTQQIHFLNDLTSFYDKKEQLNIIYLDFSKAFDKVSHLKLIHTLTHYKVHPCLINWIENYLSGRSQSTLVEDTYSSSIQVTSGVPQGSVLGPLLFSIYLQDLINKIVTNCKNVKVYAFADDLKLVSPCSKDLQNALDIVYSWVKNWELLINADKSEHLIIRCTTATTFYLGPQIIPRVSNVRDLGVIITDQLKWNSYVNKIRSKSNILSHIILRCFSPTNIKLLTNLYKIYIRPLLEYNTCTWSPHLKSDIKDIEIVQKSFTRKLCQRANISFSSYSDRLNILNLESLESRRTKNDLFLLYKIIHGHVDIKFNSFFQFSSLGGYSLRRHNMHITRTTSPKSHCRHNFFSNRVVPVWNALPEDVVNSPTLAKFKFNLKKLSF